MADKMTEVTFAHDLKVMAAQEAIRLQHATPHRTMGGISPLQGLRSSEGGKELLETKDVSHRLITQRTVGLDEFDTGIPSEIASRLLELRESLSLPKSGQLVVSWKPVHGRNHLLAFDATYTYEQENV